MSRKYISFLTAILLILGLCGCNNEDATTSDVSVTDNDKYRSVTMEEYDVSFEVPNDWYVDMEDTELDMFCTNDKIHMAVFGYYTDDFVDDADYLDIWERQNESILEEFGSVRKIGHTPEFESEDKQLETVLYSSEVQDIKQYTYFVFAMPKENSNVFLWIEFSGFPSNMRNKFNVLEDIVDSIQFK